MSKTQITIEQVNKVAPHPDADLLDVVQVLGYSVVTQKGDFQVGDSVIYFPFDILLPEDVADLFGVKKYLRHSVYPGDSKKTQCRVSACRLRGVPSYGFLAPYDGPEGFGTDVSEMYRAKKYFPPARVIGGDCLSPVKEFHEYTDIENIQKYLGAFTDEKVVITEKINGCLIHGSKITMSDGGKKKIGHIRKGEWVLGLNTKGQVIPTEVVNTFQNGPGDTWLNVKATFEKAGRGSSYVSVKCTPNHCFWSPSKHSYVPAEQLKPGSDILVRRTDPGLGYVAEQVLLGKLLGDGYLQVLNVSASVQFGHANKDLTDWTLKAIGKLAGETHMQTSGYGSQIFASRTVSLKDIKTKFESFYTDKKVVPDWVSRELSPLAIAFWYMDDGSLSHHEGQEDRAHFAVCGFTKDDCSILQKGLEKFGINTVYYVSNGYSHFRLNADDAEKLFVLIAKYIPSSLQYKLPERYRGHKGWLPITAYKPETVVQKVISVEKIFVHSKKYDLETTTHNFFAQNILVHNSNARLGIVNGELMAGSHRTRRKEGDPRTMYWQPMGLVEPLLRELYSYFSEPVIIFGEIFGQRIQDMDYGQPVPSFRAFDITHGGRYINNVLFQWYCNEFNVPTVPKLYKGTYSVDVVRELTDGPTTVPGSDNSRCKFKGREGIVIKPLYEKYSEVLSGRLILKSVSVDYHQRKDAKDDG